jgi:hypothetical protein
LNLYDQSPLHTDLFLGFDPGGDKRFGVASLIGSKVSFGTVGSIKAAIDWAIETSNGTAPCAVGIDTILHWATGKSGFRQADEWLKEKYPNALGSIMAPNSLYGAMIIGGVGLAIELKNIWPSLVLNETHPKVLYHALTKLPYPRKNLQLAINWLATQTQLNLSKPTPSEDEFDAILSAWATREALIRQWSDLVASDDKHIYPINNVRYFWPRSN